LNKKIKLVVIDRDGTLIIDKHYINDPNKVQLIPGTIPGIKNLINSKILIALHTNQSGINRGYFTKEIVHRINLKMIELIGLGKNIFSDICVAPNIFWNKNNYRKPSPKFTLELMNKYNLDSKSIAYIGDTSKDKDCAENIGCRFYWLAYQNKEKLNCKPYMSLNEIVNHILN